MPSRFEPSTAGEPTRPRLVLVGGAHAPRMGAESSRDPEPDDGELLDAYSRTVVTVVDSVGPAVVSIEAGRPSRRRSEVTGAGSGVLITPDGYLLTNHQVVDRARSLRIALPDGRVMSAALIGSDPATDLALLRAEASSVPHARPFSPRTTPTQLRLNFGIQIRAFKALRAASARGKPQ